MNDTQQALTELTSVFFPYHTARTETIRARGGRFVYYTTAETAMKILRSQEFWLRNAMLMNDFSEIAHGMECLAAGYHGRGGEVLRSALEMSFPGLPTEIEALYNDLVPTIRHDTFLTCLSEHQTAEDRRGRLSMWRAYGGRTGTALIINGGVMHSPSMALGAFSSPVYYADPIEFASAFEHVARGIAAKRDLLERVGRESVKLLVFNMLRFAALCTKHPAFCEELEWRVIASPTMFTTGRLIPALETVNGVPQKVLKIRLENAPEEGLSGLALPELLDSIIVGPCEFPAITAIAFREQLAQLGVPDWERRVIVADIPLRHDY